MMRRGCPASSENITPRVAVDTISSVTPIMPSVFSPSKGKSTIPKRSYHSKTEYKCLFVLHLPNKPPNVIVGESAAK